MASSKQKIASAFHEVYEKTPKTVMATGKTGEAKRKMLVAVALSKARQKGASIPKMHDGGTVPSDGPYELQKGERVIPVNKPDPCAVNEEIEPLDTIYKGPETQANCPVDHPSSASHIFQSAPIDLLKKELDEKYEV